MKLEKPIQSHLLHAWFFFLSFLLPLNVHWLEKKSSRIRLSLWRRKISSSWLVYFDWMNFFSFSLLPALLWSLSDRQSDVLLQRHCPLCPPEFAESGRWSRTVGSWCDILCQRAFSCDLVIPFCFFFVLFFVLFFVFAAGQSSSGICFFSFSFPGVFA